MCTTSRKHTGPTGPVTPEHLATLQEQQRRLTQAVSNMARVIKRAESQGFVDDSSSGSAVHELSSVEMGEVLQKFAPDDAASDHAASSASNSDSSSKKRKLEATASPDADMDIDAFMDQSQAATTNSNMKDLQPFEKFLATFQQQNSNGSAFFANTTAPPLSKNLGPHLSDPSTISQEMPFVAPAGSSSAFDLPPQLGPFMDLVDWDASLEHLLESQQPGGTNFDWDPNGMAPGDFGLPDATS